jgi:hypothetical protein
MVNGVCGIIQASQAREDADSLERQPQSVLILLRLLAWIARAYLVRGAKPIVNAVKRLERPLWIARYSLVLGAGGLYTGFMLLEHYEGLSSRIIDWLFNEAGADIAPLYLKHTIEGLVFVALWVCGSSLMMLWLRFVRVRNERRLYEYLGHHDQPAFLGGVRRDLLSVVRSLVDDFHRYLEWLQISTTRSHQGGTRHDRAQKGNAP